MRKNRVKILRIASGYGEMLKKPEKKRTAAQEEKDIRSFAHFYGISVSNLLDWESQKRIPSYSFAKKICEQRGVPIEFIYGYVYSKGRKIEEVENKTIIEDHKKASAEYKKYIEFKECDCTFAKSFLLAENFDAIQSIEDLDTAAADGKVDKNDPRLTKYLHTLFNIEK